MNKKRLIFTDLDGTLLDHYSYQTDPASEMIATLKENNVPIIPNSSKTLDEILLIRQQLQLSDPFIVENGAAVYIPINYFKTQPADTKVENGFWVKSFCKDKAYWLALLQQSTPDFQKLFKGFSAMSDAELAALTGLSVENAAMAKQRQYGEPINWLGDEIEKSKFIEQMNQLGANILQGGRFLHVSGYCDKGNAQSWLAEQYQMEEPSKTVLTIALGDGKNDIAMLEAATIAVQIRSPVHDFPTLKRTQYVYQSRLYGPAGWAECLNEILSSKLTS
jgi:mannosyl-3-phosphoglycerate phosphatase